MEIKISEVIRNKRRELNLSQEGLAEIFGITVQAVSKWETGLSYPDITLLPKLSEYFKISLDGLFFGEGESSVLEGIPDDGRLRVVQCLGGKVIKKEEYNRDKPFELVIPQNNDDNSQLDFEIWGDANIKGNISGYVNSGGGVNCSGVGGSVKAGGGVNCADVGGDVHAGGGISCGDVSGKVRAGGDVECGNIGESASAGNDIKCDSINGDAKAGLKITCKRIGGNVKCDGKVIVVNNEIDCSEQ